MKVVFGASIFISAAISSVWGFASIGEIVKVFVDSWLGRILLVFLGISYLINGTWRFFHSKN